VSNNPLSYTDPSGYFVKGLMKAIGIGINFVPGFQGWGGAVMQGFISGYMVTAGDPRAAAVGAMGGAMFHGIGNQYGDVGFGSAQHMQKTLAHGMAGGLLSTAGGGRFGDGFLGAAAGQAMAPAIDGIGRGSDGQIANDPGQQLARVTAAAAAGGTASALGGGKFANGAKTFGFMRLFREIPAYYRRIVRYELDIMPGGEAEGKGETQMPVAGANNVGTQHAEVDPSCIFCEGGGVSRVANQIPGVNAVAGMHDVFQVSMGTSIWRDVLNIPGMALAAGITYPGFLGQVLNNAPAGVYLPVRLGNRKSQSGSIWVPAGGF
ncbi:MAG TPA: hypothetical protein PK205_18905, partial [Promineifilum sp.]|nr:hypothetical protein [Promineifilum sp.]